MSLLPILQQNFQQFLLKGTTDIKKLIVPTKKNDVLERLDIYKNAYQARLVEALSMNYPCLHAFLGEEFFQEVAIDYIAQYPSQSRSIRWFGDDLPSFIKEYFEKEHAYLADLAAFEWVMTLVFDAQDAPIFPLDGLHGISDTAWEQMRILFHPAMTRLVLDWNIVPLWEAISKGEKIPQDIEKYKIPDQWMIWRRDNTIQFVSLSRDEATCIDVLQQGRSFGAMCEILCQWHAEDEVGVRAASLLKTWLTAGLIANCTTS